MRDLSRFILAAACATGFSVLTGSKVCAAEPPIGTVTGTVTDSDGHKVEGARVVIIVPNRREGGQGQGPQGEGPGEGAARPPRPDGAGPQGGGNQPGGPGGEAPNGNRPAPPERDGQQPPPPPAEGNAQGGGQPERRNDAGGPPPADGNGEGRGGAPGGRRPPPPLATGFTDKDGSFTLNLPAGHYMILARLPEHGLARMPVDVEPDKSATVTLKLEERGEEGNGRGGPGAPRGEGDRGGPAPDNNRQPPGNSRPGSN